MIDSKLKDFTVDELVKEIKTRTKAGVIVYACHASGNHAVVLNQWGNKVACRNFAKAFTALTGEDVPAQD